MPEMTALERLGRSMAARGYVVVANLYGDDLKPGQVLNDVWFGDAGRFPVRVLCETNEADFDEHCRIMEDTKPPRWNARRCYRYYRVEAD